MTAAREESGQHTLAPHDRRNVTILFADAEALGANYQLSLIRQEEAALAERQ
jgi:hypothetical protein